MAEVRLKEALGKDGKKRCVVDHKPGFIDVPYRFDQPPPLPGA